MFLFGFFLLLQAEEIYNWEPKFKSQMCRNPLLSIYPEGQLISATTEEIVRAYYPAYFLLSVAGQIQTRQVQGSYDDSYLGKYVPFLTLMVIILKRLFTVLLLSFDLYIFCCMFASKSQPSLLVCKLAA